MSYVTDTHFTPDVKERIVGALQVKGAPRPCPMCGTLRWTLADGYVLIPLLQDYAATAFVVGGPAVPCAALVCTNCGHVSYHALGPLGLLPTQPGERAP